MYTTWTPTETASEYAKKTIDKLPRPALINIVEAWLATLPPRQCNHKGWPTDILADWVWSMVESPKHGRRCSPDGRYLWISPDGYWKIDISHTQRPEDTSMSSPADRALRNLVEALLRVDTAKNLLSDAQGRKRSEEFISKLETLLRVDLENLDEQSKKFVQAYYNENATGVYRDEISWIPKPEE